MVAPNSITIRKERFYPHPPEDVWAAISDPHALAEWLEPNDHRPVVGHKFLKKLIPRIIMRVENGTFSPSAIPLKKRYYTCKSVPEQFIR